MTTASHLTFDSYSNTSYFANVGRAARGLIAALMAHKPAAAPAASSAAAETAPAMSASAQRRKAASLATLYELARREDSLSPNLAAELRFMASRG